MEEKIVSNVSEGIRDGERNWKVNSLIIYYYYVIIIHLL